MPGPHRCGVVEDAGELAARLQSDGFAVVRLLDPTAVEQLLDAFVALRVDDEPWFTSTGHADRPTAIEVDAMVRDRVGPAIAGLLPGWVAFVGAFISKAPCPESVVFLHQDWTYVDERRARAFVVWCPLVPVGVREGTLHVVPGSHRWSDRTRGSHFPQPYEQVEQVVIERFCLPVPLEAGQAVVYDSALLHYSPPNDSDRVRPVVAAGLAPAGMPLVHHWSDPDGHVRVFLVDGPYFTAQVNGLEPAGYPVIERYLLEDDRVDEAELAGLVKAGVRPGRASRPDG